MSLRPNIGDENWLGCRISRRYVCTRFRPVVLRSYKEGMGRSPILTFYDQRTTDLQLRLYRWHYMSSNLQNGTSFYSLCDAFLIRKKLFANVPRSPWATYVPEQDPKGSFSFNLQKMTHEMLIYQYIYMYFANKKSKVHKIPDTIFYQKTTKHFWMSFWPEYSLLEFIACLLYWQYYFG